MEMQKVVLMGIVMAVSTKVEFADMLQVGVIKKRTRRWLLSFYEENRMNGEATFRDYFLHSAERRGKRCKTIFWPLTSVYRCQE